MASRRSGHQPTRVPTDARPARAYALRADTRQVSPCAALCPVVRRVTAGPSQLFCCARVGGLPSLFVKLIISFVVRRHSARRRDGPASAPCCLRLRRSLQRLGRWPGSRMRPHARRQAAPCATAALSDRSWTRASSQGRDSAWSVKPGAPQGCRPMRGGATATMKLAQAIQAVATRVPGARGQHRRRRQTEELSRQVWAMMLRRIKTVD